MAGKYKVDVIRGSYPSSRRSSHKTLDDAVLQSKRSLAKEGTGDIVFKIILNGDVIQTITREDL